MIPILQREYDDFKTEATKFLAGEMEEDEFIKFRLKQGVYGQRQPDVQMIRVKLPFGGITPEQMERFADVIEKYVPLNKGHITTRQNIQMHHIPLPDAEKAIRELGEAGLSSREGCGNTVRNVTGDPWAGVAKDELFDLTPYAGAYVRYFVRHPTTQAMPRKIKTAFDASAARPRDQRDPRHRLPGACARDRRPGRGRGAQMLVGGGTSIMPRVAPVLYDFVELDNGEYLKVAEAVFRIFDRQEWLRANRARARIKVFVDKYGIDELRRQVEEELKGDWVAERDFSVSSSGCSWTTSARALRRPRRATARPNGDVSEFERFRRTNVPRAEAGRVRDRRGEGRPRRPARPSSSEGSAEIMRDLLRRLRPYDRPAEHRPALGARGERLRRLEGAVRARPRATPARGRSTDVVSCPGTDSCKLGITSSMGLNQASQERHRGDAHRRRADAADERQDQRLPERLRSAPRRQHRLLRSVDQSRRAHDPRLHPPRRWRVRRRTRSSSARG